MQNKREPTVLESSGHLSSLDHSPLSSAHLVLSTADVRQELIAVLAVVAANVALKGLVVAVTTHVDGEHDMVQEEDATLLALE